MGDRNNNFIKVRSFHLILLKENEENMGKKVYDLYIKINLKSFQFL